MYTKHSDRLILSVSLLLQAVPGVTAVEVSRPWTPADGHLGDTNNGCDQSPPLPPSEVDAIVVGGGFSGLTAAYELQQSGYTTLVLEATHLLGGKSRSQRLKTGPGVAELGATWINNKTQKTVYEYSERFGLDTVVQYNDGDTIFQGEDGKVTRSTPGDDSEPEDPELALQEATWLLLIEESAAKINISDWDSFPEKKDVSFADWLDSYKMWEKAHIRALSRGLSRAIVGREPEDIGAHYFLDYIKSGGGLRSLMFEDQEGAQFQWIRQGGSPSRNNDSSMMLIVDTLQGTTAIATNLAEAMTPGSVLIHSPVHSVVQHNDTAIVAIESGQSFRAKKVIIAVTQNVYDKIAFSPPLPCDKRNLVSHTKPGIYAKMAITYSKSWWRDAGLVGKFTSLAGPACFGWEISDASQDLHALMVFIAGSIAEKWSALPADEKERSIIEHLAEIFGKDLANEARDVREVQYVEWTTEEYFLGGPTTTLGAGMLRKYGAAMREPFENVHFAGTETAFVWKGYLEGAVTAGQRAAQEVVDGLTETKDA
ncbi:hypothetical protein D7B24_003933 [Verticillium nonalfalfae]|uniref:Amine oxidase n=1 Tax=Verticillium nonalfalfae TaxID=1051616 RepID=A0A3M9YE79_9PEZI|nr:uncharacterized protein D7B24_003933 [Verticillium nonalfalfae]RNJ58847.1 hypothetical protein D7B24_003933 [Verticillium nonalfalfae]